jgi:protease-4
MYNMMRPLDKKEIELMQSSVEHIYDRFTKIVAEGRSMSVSDVDAIAQGRVWTGSQALELGLVDAIGTLDQALIHAALQIDSQNGLDNIQVVEYPKPLTTAEMLASMLAGEELLEMAQSGKVYARLPYDIEIK